MRGIKIPGAPPAALRPTAATDARRRVIDTAARFDVIEIRRIWLFSETLKLIEELR